MKYLILFITFWLSISTISAQSIKTEQKKYARVRTAYAEKEQNLKPIYDFFVSNKQIPIVKVNKKGEYYIYK